jgi:hypothetical protein
MRARCFEALKHLRALSALNALTDPSPGVSWAVGFWRTRSAPDVSMWGVTSYRCTLSVKGWTSQRRIFAMGMNADGGDTVSVPAGAVT